MAAVRFFLNVDDYAYWVKNVKSTVLGGREGATQNSTLCKRLIMLTIMDDPLDPAVGWRGFRFSVSKLVLLLRVINHESQ